MLSLDMFFTIDSKKGIKSSGNVAVFDFKEKLFKRQIEKRLLDPEFSYAIEADIIDGGLQINSLELDSVYCQSAFKGKIENSLLQLQGFATVGNFGKTFIQAKQNKGKALFKVIGELLRYGKTSKKTGIVAGGLNILDVNCLVEFASKNISIKNLGFILNNIPVKLSGEINFDTGLSAKLDFSTFPDQDEKKRNNNPKRIDFKLQSQTKFGKTSGQTDIIFLKEDSFGKGLQRIQSSFNELSIGVLPDKRFKVFINKATLQYARKSGTFNFLLADFSSMLDFKKAESSFVKFNSKLYDGHLGGNIYFRRDKWPLELECKLNVDNVSAWQLESLLLSLFGAYQKLPTKLQGRIDGDFTCELNYINSPLPTLKGKTIIKNGYLKNVKFFVWLSEFFNLPDLKHLDFKELFVQFESNPNFSKLENIKLKSDQISLKGDFLLKSDEFVSSDISITFARKLLKRSSKFKLLLALMGKKEKSLNFDFKLSGVYTSLNFKWEKSIFKQKLRKILPGFIERGMERKVERAIQSISPDS